MIFVSQILCTHRITTEPLPISVIKVLITGYYPNTSTAPDSRNRYSSLSGHFSATKPQITSSTSSKRPIIEKNSGSAHTNKIMITEVIVTDPNVNTGTLFSVFLYN